MYYVNSFTALAFGFLLSLVVCFFNFIFRPSKFCISITVQLPFSSPESTYCNKPWETFFKEAGNSPEEIWFGVVCDVKLAFKSFQHLKFLRKFSWSISYYLTVQLLCYFYNSGGVVVRALASHQCGPGSISRLGVTCGLSLLVLYSSLRAFPPSSKTYI